MSDPLVRLATRRSRLVLGWMLLTLATVVGAQQERGGRVVPDAERISTGC